MQPEYCVPPPPSRRPLEGSTAGSTNGILMYLQKASHSQDPYVPAGERRVGVESVRPAHLVEVV